MAGYGKSFNIERAAEQQKTGIACFLLLPFPPAAGPLFVAQ